MEGSQSLFDKPFTFAFFYRTFCSFVQFLFQRDPVTGNAEEERKMALSIVDKVAAHRPLTLETGVRCKCAG